MFRSIQILLLLAILRLTIINAQYGRSSRRAIGIEIVTEWKKLDYGFPTQEDRQQAIDSGNLIAESGTPIDVDVAYTHHGKQRIFVTIPKFQNGIPYTLATVTAQRGANGPLLQPYPNYDWHNSHGANCDQITSAFRVAITECGQIWVIDSGIVGNEQRCSPQLLLFDLATDQLLQRYRFESDIYVPRASLFIMPLVVVHDPPPHGNCAHTMVYISDVSYHGLVVYDRHINAAWRVENPSMYPDPDFAIHTIAGENFTLMDGMFALSTDRRNLYFHPLASVSEYAVPLQVLDNRQNWLNGPEAQEQQFIRLGSRKSECAASAMDSRGDLFCVTFNPIKLIFWRINTPYETRNFRIVSADSKYLEFVSGMKIVRNIGGQEELWMFSNRFQKISAGTVNWNEINFRILRRSLADLQNGVTYEDNDLANRLLFS